MTSYLFNLIAITHL